MIYINNKTTLLLTHPDKLKTQPLANIRGLQTLYCGPGGNTLKLKPALTEELTAPITRRIQVDIYQYTAPRMAQREAILNRNEEIRKQGSDYSTRKLEKPASKIHTLFRSCRQWLAERF